MFANLGITYQTAGTGEDSGLTGKASIRRSDDQALHCAVLAYASDTSLLDIALYLRGVSWCV